MYCPVCRSEFLEGVSVCPDDGVKLVDQLPADRRFPKETHREPVHPELAGHGLLREELIPEEPVPEWLIPADAVPEGSVLIYRGRVFAPPDRPSPDFVRSALEENEIRTFAVGEHLPMGDWAPDDANEAVAIYVPAEDADRSRELIAQVVEGRPPEPAPGEAGEE